jgi:hypothetical protein
MVRIEAGWDGDMQLTPLGGPLFRVKVRWVKIQGLVIPARTFWVKMVSVNEGRLVPAPLNEMAEDDRVAAIARLRDVFSDGMVTLERFVEVLEHICTASNHTDLREAMVTLPPLVRPTPPWLRLTRPLVLRTADDGLLFGPGWQLAIDTTVSTGLGAARLDLTTASWDAQNINLRLETWGSIDVLVPEGVAVQLVGGSRPVQLQSLSLPTPGGPVLRISTFGPTGVIRIRHPEACHARRFIRWRRRWSSSTTISKRR